MLFALGTLVPLSLPAISGGFARQALKVIAPAGPNLARLSGHLLMAAGALIVLDAALFPALMHQSVQGGMHH